MANGRNRIWGGDPPRARSTAVYYIRGHHRSELCASAFLAGLHALGQPALHLDEATWDGKPRTEVAVFYGLEGNMPAIFDAYRSSAQHTAVYVDLGYWGRRDGGRWTGFHKVVVDDRHPLRYLMRRPLPRARLDRFPLYIEPLRKEGKHIVLAGMGDKGALAEGFQPEQWERATIAKIRQVTDRPIVYRPKPSWKTARPIEGARYSPRTVELEKELRDCWAVVTHHSNVAVDAVVAGIPVYCEGGAALPFSMKSLGELESDSRWYPQLSTAARTQWAANLAFCQWSIEEMKQGLPWLHLRTEGLV